MNQLLKSLVRRCLAKTPYEVRKRRAESSLPEPSLDCIQLVLPFYLQRKAIATFLQIGACDGRSGDPVYHSVSTGKLRAFVVEPIEESYLKLRQSYDGVSNVTPIMAALGSTDGEVTLYKVKQGARSMDAFWSRQLASFERSHLLRHGVLNEEIEAVKVPGFTLPSLCHKYQIGKIDILQVDTEGFDAEVVKMALQLPELPECINFENVHLSESAQSDLFSRLQKHGYLWTHDKWNTLAVQKCVLEKLP